MCKYCDRWAGLRPPLLTALCQTNRHGSKLQKLGTLTLRQHLICHPIWFKFTISSTNRIWTHTGYPGWLDWEIVLFLGLAKCPQLNKSNHPSTRDGGQHDLPRVATECWDTFGSAGINPSIIQNRVKQSEPQPFVQTWFRLISIIKLIYL